MNKQIGKMALCLLLTAALTVTLAVSALADQPADPTEKTIIGDATSTTPPTGDVELKGSVTQDANLIAVTIPTAVTFKIIVDADGKLRTQTSSTLEDGWDSGKNITTGVLTATNGQIINNSVFAVDVSLTGVADSGGLLDKLDLAVVPVHFGDAPPSLDADKTMADQDGAIKDYQITAGTPDITLRTGLGKDQPGDTEKDDNWYLWLYGLPKAGADDAAHTFATETEYTITTTLKVTKHV